MLGRLAAATKVYHISNNLIFRQPVTGKMIATSLAMGIVKDHISKMILMLPTVMMVRLSRDLIVCA